jgi:UDP-glucose:(heptosyl)LPS alpha-1,3-glucosyltransferase
MRMKIALVIENFHPAAGGNERSTDQIARGLIARGHQVTVLANRAEESSLPPGGQVKARGGLSTGLSLGLRLFARWVQRELNTGGYDVSMSMTTAAPAAVLQPRGGTVRENRLRNQARRPPGPRRWMKRLGLAMNLKQRALLRMERRTLHDPSVRRIVAISWYVMDQLFTHYEIRSRQMEMIPNAAEITPMDPQARARLRQQVRQSLMLGPGDVAFLFAAMNPALKGLDELLRAVRRLALHQPEARLIVAGTHQQSYLAAAERLGVRDRLRWVGPTRRMDDLYAACDVTILPTWYDPASKVVLESLLHGVPAITTACNGACQWVIDPSGRTRPPSPLRPGSLTTGDGAHPAGRVIDSPARIEAMAQAMAELCDPEERLACSRATAGLAARISMDRHVQDLERVLEQVAGELRGA